MTSTFTDLLWPLHGLLGPYQTDIATYRLNPRAAPWPTGMQIVNRPGVAGAVLHTASLLINSVTQ